jgi:hypothetical protein
MAVGAEISEVAVEVPTATAGFLLFCAYQEWLR